jgi:hypothetical protein
MQARNRTGLVRVTVMKQTRNFKAGASILAGIAFCSIAALTDVTPAHAQDNNAASLPQVDVTAAKPQTAARSQHVSHAGYAAGGTAMASRLPPNTLVNIGPFVSVPAEAAHPIGMPVTASDCRMSVRPGQPYFVEFRSRTAATYGHAFVFYGKLADNGHFAWVKVAGLHPAGDSSTTYLMGHVLPVASETGASYGDLDEQYMTARFCVTLTEAEFQRVSAYINQLQHSLPLWNALTMNCTAFDGMIARFMGYQAPANHLQVPEDYINEMHRLNSSPAQYAAYLAEMRRVNSIPVPRVPPETPVTLAGRAAAPAVAAPAPVAVAARPQTVATAPILPSTGW